MNIPTANIVIGFNKEVMERLFTAGATYKNLIQGLTLDGIEDVLLFDSQANPNFISFEHSLGMGGGMKMKLTLIDPKGEFERRFVSNNVIKNIAGFEYNDDQNANDEKDSFDDQVNRDMKRSSSLYDDQYFSELREELVKHQGTKELYVAYGTGNNLDLWSGPHRTILTGADLTLKGARKITLQLTPTQSSLQLGQRRGAYNEVVNLDLAGLTMRYSGISKPIQFKEMLEGVPAYDPTRYLPGLGDNWFTVNDQYNKVVEDLRKSGNELVSNELEYFDFHSMVVDAVRSYVQKATSNPNVIVLLPNLNVVCRKVINETIVNTRSARKAAVETAAVAGATTAQAVMGPMFGNFVKKAQEFKFSEDYTSLGYKEQLVSNLLTSLGLELHTVFRDFIKGTSVKAIPYSSVARLKNWEKTKTPRERSEVYFDKRDFYAILEKADNKGIPDHMDAIRTVMNSILKHSKEDYQLRFVIVNETDTKVLNYWSTNSKNIELPKYPTFGGYSTFNTEKEAIILGDQTLIRDYLYGRANLEAKQESVSFYEKQAALAEENHQKALEAAKAAKKGAEIFDTNAGIFATAASWGLSAIEQGQTLSASAAEQEYKNNLLAAVKTIPLHPLDAVVLTDEVYQKGIRDIVNPVLKGVGAFGDISQIPDEFAFHGQEIAPDLETFAREEGINIFRYNTANPNVIDMKFKFGAIYLAQLKSGFKKMVNRRASAVAEGTLPIGTGTLPIRTVGAAAAYLRQKDIAEGTGDKARKKALKELAGKISLDVLEELDVDNHQEGANAVAAILDNQTKENHKGVIEIDQLIDGNPQTIMTDLMQDMYRKALRMSITTLPSFHISNTWDINSPCLLFAQDAPIYQTNEPERTLMNSFFSGLYKIVGFKHKITTSKSESEFSLVKNLPKYKEKEKEPVTLAEFSEGFLAAGVSEEINK
jgi:hypothetical protein